MQVEALEVVKKEKKANLKEGRESNIELLRIVSTLFIFVYHYMIAGAISEVYVYTNNKIVALFLSTEGQVGVNIFFLITGYFMINSKFKIRKLLKLFLQVFFYSVGLALLELYTSQLSFKDMDIAPFLKPITQNIYWFATVYAYVYIFTPFLNKMIKGLGKRGCEVFLIFFGVLLSILPTFFNKYFMYSELRWGIYMYVLGAYISLFKIEFRNKKTGLLIAIFHPICIFLLEILVIFLDKKFDIHISKDKCICMYSIYSIVGAVGYFLFFKSLKIKQSKIINYISKVSFVTFLISGHQLYQRHFWFLDCRTDLVINSPIYVFLLHTILCVIGIYILAIITEFLRVNLLEKPLFRILKIKPLDRFLNKFDNWINAI